MSFAPKQSYLFCLFFRYDTWARFHPIEWRELKESVDDILRQYRPSIDRLAQTWEDGTDGTYVEEWDLYLEGPYEGGDGEDGAQARHEELMAYLASARAVRVAALHATEYTKLQAWLAENGPVGLYARFEEYLRDEYAAGSYPGVPVRDIPEE